jgi:hypothetical protein
VVSITVVFAVNAFVFNVLNLHFSGIMMQKRILKG